MGYYNNSWDSSYANAKRLLGNAKGFYDMKAKAKTLKQAWNAAFGLPDDYIGRDELLREIENYAYNCDIDLSQVSGY